MKTALTIGSISARSGEKISGYVTVPGTNYSFPVSIINGKEDGKKMVVSAGIHGWEYPGILATLELAREIDPGEVKGAIILPHIINFSGFLERQTYVVPNDEKRQNLNRMYPGDPNDTTLAGRIVRFTSDLVKGCDFHIDLHSGDACELLDEIVIVAYSSGEIYEKSLAAAKVTGFRYRMDSGGITEYYNSSAINLGVPSLLFERGGNGTYTKKEVADNKRDILAIARHLGILPGEAAVNENQIYMDRKCWAEAEATGLFYSFVNLGDIVREGQKIYEIRDIYGKLLAEHHAQFNARIFILPSTLAIRKGDDTVMYGTSPCL